MNKINRSDIQDKLCTILDYMQILNNKIMSEKQDEVKSSFIIIESINKYLSGKIFDDMGTC